MQQSLNQRKRSFLNGLASVQAQRNTPLPPSLTGVQYPPGYDPATSPWLRLDVSSTELGTIRLAGKDVDIYRLWALVLQNGGGARACISISLPMMSTFNLLRPGVESRHVDPSRTPS